MATASEIALAALKTALDGGRMYWFSGPVPADETVALDMDAQHTELVVMTINGAGVTGLTFASPVGTAMTKTPSEVWTGTVDFVGANASADDQTASFYRFCAAGDNGRGAASGPRLQGTIGGAGAGIPMTNPVLEDNGVNTQGMDYFAVVESAVG